MKIYFQRHLMVFYTLSWEIQGSWVMSPSVFSFQNIMTGSGGITTFICKIGMGATQ